MSLANLFHFFCTQHVSDIDISIIRSLRLCCWITTLVVLFLVHCVLEIWCGWVWVVSMLQAEAQQVVLQPATLMMDISMSKTCGAQKKWNKLASDIKLVFYSSTITMMRGLINIKLHGIQCFQLGTDYMYSYVSWHFCCSGYFLHAFLFTIGQQKELGYKWIHVIFSKLQTFYHVIYLLCVL